MKKVKRNRKKTDVEEEQEWFEDAMHHVGQLLHNPLLEAM